VNLSLKIDILGTTYTIEEKAKDEDSFLESCAGYCDKTTKKIVILNNDPESELDDYGWFKKKVTRHEIIHAFLFESGLHENWYHKDAGHDETVVDWIAVQFPKMLRVFEVAGCLEG
jgi:hypothetical protein